MPARCPGFSSTSHRSRGAERQRGHSRCRCSALANCPAWRHRRRGALHERQFSAPGNRRVGEPAHQVGQRRQGGSGGARWPRGASGGLSAAGDRGPSRRRSAVSCGTPRQPERRHDRGGAQDYRRAGAACGLTSREHCSTGMRRAAWTASSLGLASTKVMFCVCGAVPGPAVTLALAAPGPSVDAGTSERQRNMPSAAGVAASSRRRCGPRCRRCRPRRGSPSRGTARPGRQAPLSTPTAGRCSAGRRAGSSGIGTPNTTGCNCRGRRRDAP